MTYLILKQGWFDKFPYFPDKIGKCNDCSKGDRRVDMGHELARHIDVDNLHMEVRIEMNESVGQTLYPPVYEELTRGGGKHKLIK